MATMILAEKITVLVLLLGSYLLMVADCVSLEGLVAPIEVIEEWGCFDSEIRLTCGNLDSTMAVLEAKFTPHCNEERAEDCVYVDENSIARSFSAQKLDKFTLEEKEAGQRFLQTLRRNHENKRLLEETSPSVGAVQVANGAVNARTTKDKRSSLRNTLEHLIVRYLRRITSSGEDEEGDESGGFESSSARYRRQVAMVDGNETSNGARNEALHSSVEITLLTNDTDGENGSVLSDISGSIGSPSTDGIIKGVVESVNVPSSTFVSSVDERNSQIVEASDVGEEQSGKERNRKTKSRECTSIRKRVSQLDKIEFEKSLRNDSFREYNIRNALNYRCSGQNHCSFVFAQDHPYAVVWREGIVRVKYICMDDFRISKYCDEHLILGNENRWERRRKNQQTNRERDVSGSVTMATSTIRDEIPQDYAVDGNNDPVGFAEDRKHWSYDDKDYGIDAGDDDDDDNDEPEEYGYDDNGPRGEPRAEALQQGQQQIQQSHSFHNLKILKTLPGAEVLVNETENQRKLDADAANRQHQRQRQKVFSQDFRVLKILPSDLDEVEDIKQVGNEYYFKKDVEVIDDSENEIVPVAEIAPRNDSTTQFTETLDIVVLPPPTRDVDVYDSSLDKIVGVNDSVESDEKTTITLVDLIVPTMGSSLENSTSQKQFLDGSVSTYESSFSTQGTFSTKGTFVNTPQSGYPVLVTTSASSEPPTKASDELDDQKNLEKAPDVESNEIEENAKTSTNLNNETDDDFSFNNRTFRKMQETVLEEMSGKKFDDREGYPVSYDYSDEDDFEQDDNNDDYEETEKRSHKKYISIQRTLLKHPLRQGFLMTPGYPKYYIGDSVCRWTLYTQRLQKIKLTILDLALRFDEPCRDYVEIRDLATNQTLFSSCTESTRPIEVISLQERIEVNVRTTTKVAYPKRGVLIHYSEKRSTEGSGLVSHYEQKRKFSDSENMSDKQADTVYDILIPSLVIAALFIVNGIVFAVIMRYRNKRKQRLELDSKELAEL
ncbi:uncharacterized protein LOC131428140 isoform X2 [Malaya genurostris]|uniref:uncharacterized protein LOC131428140 isoform X2 n=1 Tax=Malaya genurostris TaxID=325434 RepID=UPI0026F3F21A|nr:uncharacterized protein LOC131428140 isoform X2 [Malaya genurostris]